MTVIRRWLVLDPDYGDAVGAASTQHEAEQIARDYVPPYPVVEVVPASQLQGAVTALRDLVDAAEGVTETRNYDAAVRWRKALDHAITALPHGGQ